MDRGTYASASAGLYQLRRLDVLNHNLSNVNTPGYKGQVITAERREFDQTLAAKLVPDEAYVQADQERSPGVVNIKTQTDFRQGPIQVTGNPLNAALNNANDFFVINTPEGPQYTRAGNFTLASEGELVTAEGFQVLGDGGAITTTGGEVQISANGSVLSDGEVVGRLQVVRFPTTEGLVRTAGARFQLTGGDAPPILEDPQITTSALEMSNVSAIESMVQLISANRGFELYTKSARTIDEMNQTATRDLGRPRA